MDHPTTILSLLMEIIIWRRNPSIHHKKVKFHCTDFHLSTVHDYLINHYRTCDFRDVRLARFFKVSFRYAGPGSSRIRSKIASCFTQELKGLFMVPRLNMFFQGENRIKKYQLVQVFITFLLELLYYNQIESFDPYRNQIDSLENELRFLLTILGDKSLMLHDNEHEEFQNLTVEFEAVANKAGSFVHSLLFSTDQASGKIDDGLAAVLNHINLLRANIMEFLNILPSITKPSYTTPETSVVDSYILNSLIHDLEDLISREDILIADGMDQIKILHQRLTFLQSSIKAVGSLQHSEIGEWKEPLKRIGNMAHQTEYVIISVLSGAAPLWYLINRLTDINQKIELIGIEIQEITMKHNLEVAKDFNTQLPLQTKGSIEVDDVTVGFEDREIYILDQLEGGCAELQVSTIFGMAGVGKSTLAKKLYNHPLIRNRFDRRSWCVISQNHRQGLLNEIFIQLTGELDINRTSKMGEESLVDVIYKTLYGRRYLIVMDDVWDSHLWDDLQRFFPDQGNGSRILFTTRNRDVAPPSPNSIIYELPLLSNDQCWELLEKKVFGNETCPPELIGMGKGIAENCCGLPLAVVVVAGILSTMDKEKYTWQAVRDNLASYVLYGGDNSVMQILELSYKHLPEHLKLCFLYFRAFPEGREIPVRKLMRLWISEGFIQKEEGKSADDVAEEYLMELIGRSLVIVSKRRSDGGVKACVLHDLLQDLCFEICEEENFLKIAESNTYSIYENGLHHRQALEQCIFWMNWLRDRSSSYRQSISLVYKKGLHHRPALSVRNYINWSYCQQVRSFHGEHQISPFYLCRMRILRVLNFDYISGHLIGIEYLVNLRYLVVSELPESIGNLLNLEYLRIETHNAVPLPQAILRLMKLRYLNVGLARYRRYRNGFQTNNLEFLSCISIRKLEDEEMLKYSPNLRKLKCICKRRGSSSNLDLSFLTQLESLNLMLYGPGVMGIGIPSNIKRLSLHGCELPWESMSIIGKFERLEVLKLGLRAFEGERWDTQDGGFQMLKFLKLDRMQNLIEWNVESSGHFPKLQQLVLNDCDNLQEVPCEIGELATLQLIEVKGQCKESLVQSAKRIKQEQLDMGNEELRVVISVREDNGSTTTSADSPT